MELRSLPCNKKKKQEQLNEKTFRDRGSGFVVNRVVYDVTFKPPSTVKL